MKKILNSYNNYSYTPPTHTHIYICMYVCIDKVYDSFTITIVKLSILQIFDIGDYSFHNDHT